MKSVPSKVVGDTYTADEFTAGVSQEAQNAILDTGQVLNAGDLFQTSKAMSIYGSGGDFYVDSGSTNSIIFSPVGLKKAPPAYFDGQRISGFVGNDTTGSVTVNVDGVGVITMNFDGAVLNTGFFTAGDYFEARYNSSGAVFDVVQVGVGRQTDFPINVTWFGAKGDGTTDDTVAIQDAIDSIKTNGGTVIFPTGTYVIDSGNSIGVDVNGFNDVALLGEKGSVILNPDAAVEGRPFVMRNGDGLLVEGLTFECLETGARTTNGIDVQNVDNATVRNNVFRGQTFFGLLVAEDTIAPLNGTCDNLVVEGNLFEDVDEIGAEIFPKLLSTTQIIRNNTFVRCGTVANGTAFKCAQGYEHANVHDNTMIDCGVAGLESFAASISLWRVCDFHDNLFINSVRASIAISMDTHGSFSDETFKSLKVRNNTIMYSDAHVLESDPAITLSVADTTAYALSEGTIEFVRNDTINGHRGFECRPIVDIDRITLDKNSFMNMAEIGIFTDNANTGVMVNPIINSNDFINNDSTRTVEDIRLFDVAGSTVTDNTFVRSGDQAILYDLTTGEHINTGNKYIDGQVVAGPTRGAIRSNDTTATTYIIHNNTQSGGNNAGLYLGVNATPTVNFSGNVAPKLTTDGVPTRVVANIIGDRTSSGDVAVNGFITVLDSDGVSRKLATVA